MVVGVTGGIASGKTMVCRVFEEQGAKIVDADRIGREVVEEEPGMLEALRDVFGPGILTPEGALDRRKLGNRVFADREAKAKLDRMVHPPLLRRLRAGVVEALREDKDRLVVVDAALIVEWGIMDWFDVLVMVRTSERMQIERLMRRNRLSREETLNRIRSQMPDAEKAKAAYASRAASFVIWNDGTVQELRQRALEVWRAIGEIGEKKELTSGHF